MNNGNELKCFLTGLGLGVAAAILYAPRTGADTRDKIRSKAMEGSGYLKDRAMEGTDYLKTRANEAASAASDAVSQGVKTVRAQKDNLKAAVDAGREAYRDATGALQHADS